MLRRTTVSRALLSKAQHPRAEAILSQVLAAKAKRADPVAASLEAVSWGLFAVTYGIIVNWIYASHLDLWDGVYGIEDDDDEDDD